MAPRGFSGSNAATAAPWEHGDTDDEEKNYRVVANHHTIANMAAKKIATPITMEKFTLVVRLWTSTWGRPLLFLSMDMGVRMDRHRDR
jgi:hypothetical protein